MSAGARIPCPAARAGRGFTLLEMAVVLLILGLLVAGLLGPLETQLEARDRRQTLAELERIADALYGYALTHGRLPCPDADGDGRPDPAFDPADPATAVCAVGAGSLPSVELGTAQGDAWGNRFRYAVSVPRYTRPEADGLCNGNAGGAAAAHFDLCTTGQLTVLGRGDNPATGALEGKFAHTLASEVPAVVVSHGRNGYGAIAVAGGPRAEPVGEDERENWDDDAEFISRGYSRGAAGCADGGPESSPLCEFDDLLVWLSPTILNERMVAAGRLP